MPMRREPSTAERIAAHTERRVRCGCRLTYFSKTWILKYATSVHPETPDDRFASADVKAAERVFPDSLLATNLSSTLGCTLVELTIGSNAGKVPRSLKRDVRQCRDAQQVRHHAGIHRPAAICESSQSRLRGTTTNCIERACLRGLRVVPAHEQITLNRGTVTVCLHARRARIFRSSQNDHLSMYCMSSSIHVVNEMELLPLICRGE